MSTNDNSLLIASAAYTGATTSGSQANPGCSGAHVVINVTVAPTAGTITPSIVGICKGVEYTLLTGAAISTTGITVLKVRPGITAAANASAADALPQEWRVDIAHSTTTSFTYSALANLLV